MDRNIKADLYRYGGLTGTKRLLEILLRNPGFRHTYFIRKSSNCSKYSIKKLFYILLIRRSSHKYGFQIYNSKNIGEGFFIGHFGTIVIHSDVKIGNNCNITHGVTIGQAGEGNIPSIGDKVWIGTGSVITGKIIVGSNVLIAPNSFVSVDVPDNSYVRGNPARIFHVDNPTMAYISNILV